MLLDIVLFKKYNKHINTLAEAEPEKLWYVWNSLVQLQPKYEMCIFLE